MLRNFIMDLLINQSIEIISKTIYFEYFREIKLLYNKFHHSHHNYNYLT